MTMQSGVERLLEFGKHEHSLVGNMKNIFSAFTAALLWTVLMCLFLKMAMGLGTSDLRSIISAKLPVYGSAFSVSLQQAITAAMFLSCIFAPLWEELAFRYVPLKLAKSLEVMLVKSLPHKLRRSRGVEYDHERGYLYGNLKGTGFILPTVIISSIVFGVAHGGPLNIMYQGVSGLIFAWLMLKGGYWPAVIAHGMWNFMMMFGLPIILS